MISVPLPADFQRGEPKPMHRRTYPAVSFLLAFVFLAPLSYAQREITIRVVHAKSGKPIRKLFMSVDAWNGRLGPDGDMPQIHEQYSKARGNEVFVRLPPHDSAEELVFFGGITRLDNDGKIVVRLPDDLPRHMQFQLISYTGGPDSGVISPAEVLKNGVILGNSRTPHLSSVPASPTPGEIIWIAKPFSGWDYVRQEIP
jgi:hypothetical protein